MGGEAGTDRQTDRRVRGVQVHVTAPPVSPPPQGFPLCTKLLNSTKGPKETCANTTEQTLQVTGGAAGRPSPAPLIPYTHLSPRVPPRAPQEVLSELQSVVRKQQCTQHGAKSAALLIQSTEAIVLQAAHGGIRELNTTFMRTPPPSPAPTGAHDAPPTPPPAAPPKGFGAWRRPESQLGVSLVPIP